MIQYPYLISRVSDPLLALSIGVAAYYVYERRAGRPDGHRLNDLLSRKYGKN
ncbi:hypothetical protein HYPBUDRAFT_151742 [Hyphopichia burtonii NRRL Y-1933]|uniref:Non-classical export protein 1 n=1 Tax=Hyphopichia burtonii NRRL Y-1933 TaxID=984485 RepID=A0A1E4RSZ9_9ASCO|nr:hypothetical protein HYPBUDRAFT_151742 [Hyphopichia burtonii NRRL Y-1933]ODV70399.1 hypothetical protein HYPBUDRAFT_151742 [Hyphopichia burtonii NRRL Y-1933]